MTKWCASWRSWLEEFRSGAFRRLVSWGTSGQRILSHYEMDAFSRYELAKYGRSVFGADDRSSFDLPGSGNWRCATTERDKLPRDLC